MKRLRELAVQGLAFLLIVTSVLVVYGLMYSDAMGPTARLRLRAARIASRRTEVSGNWVTYRFLHPDEPGGVADKLRLARFVDGHLCEGGMWDSYSFEHWRCWAASIFSREMGWAAWNQSGWQISRWLFDDGIRECDRDYLFWSIQALRFADPEITDKEIRMIERSGKTARICLTQGCSDYDYCENTLYWNPVETERVPVDKLRGEQWFRTDPLIALARQLSHMRHDFCDNGDASDGRERDGIAAAAELRMRDILSQKDPTRPCIRPTPGRQETRGTL